MNNRRIGTNHYRVVAEVIMCYWYIGWCIGKCPLFRVSERTYVHILLYWDVHVYTYMLIFSPDVLRSSIQQSLGISSTGSMKAGPSQLSNQHPSNASLLKALWNQAESLRYNIYTCTFDMHIIILIQYTCTCFALFLTRWLLSSLLRPRR